MIVSNHNTTYDHGPGNETTEEAYLKIRTLRLHAHAERHDIREALLYLQGTPFIDDTRCLLYALETLDELSNDPKFVNSHDNIWQVIGVLSGVVLARTNKTHVEIKKYADTGKFKRKFIDAEWPIRARIIGGFIEVARRTSERDEVFWGTTDLFLRECQSHHLEARQSAALTHLVNLWWTLACDHGADAEVQRRVAQNAHPLLMLIQQTVLPISLPTWYEALRSLKLPNERDITVQSSLTKVAGEIGKHENDPDWRLKDWFTEFKEELMPYLHGRARRPPRIILSE